VNELLKLLADKVFPPGSTAPTTRAQIMSILQPFKGGKFKRMELCACGKERFLDFSILLSPPCATCGAPRFDPITNRKTTITFMWFDLCNRLRQQFCRPSRVNELMAAANHVATPLAMRDIKGTVP
jgi:hypothetical protein